MVAIRGAWSPAMIALPGPADIMIGGRVQTHNAVVDSPTQSRLAKPYPAFPVDDDVRNRARQCLDAGHVVRAG